MTLFSSRTLLLVATIILLVVVTVSTSGRVEAASPPCNCHKGTVKYSTPRCVCDCTTSGGYLAPFCSFTALESIRVEVWFDVPPIKFISDRALTVLKDNLRPLVTNTTPPVDVNKIEFLYIVAGSNNEATMGLFEMPGGCANWLYHYTWDVENRTAAWPYDKGQISAVYFTEELSAPEPYLSSLLRTTYLYNDGSVTVSLADAIWLIGVLLFVIVVPILESYYTTNDEKSIQQDVATGQLDPYGGGPQKQI